MFTEKEGFRNKQKGAARMNVSLSSSEIKLIIKLLQRERLEADGNYKGVIEDIIERLSMLVNPVFLKNP